MSKAQTNEATQKTDREIEREERLAQVTDEVAKDAQDRPAEYLKETIVPAGGE